MLTILFSASMIIYILRFTQKNYQIFSLLFVVEQTPKNRLQTKVLKTTKIKKTLALRLPSKNQSSVEAKPVDGIICLFKKAIFLTVRNLTLNYPISYEAPSSGNFSAYSRSSATLCTHWSS
jgi:hypothetical protein